MPRNPFVVLGVPLDATPETIKAAWRGLARQHHPDIISGEPGLERRANRRMAEINAAYAELRDPVKRRVHREAAARAARGDAPGAGAATHGYGGSDGYDGAATGSSADGAAWGSRSRSSRPVTARIDTSALLRPRNATLHPVDRSPLPGLPPRPRTEEWREPPRASTPTGPTYRHRGPNLEAQFPSVPNALETRLKFGKFAGLTVGEVGVIEPAYLDWIVRTIGRDLEVNLAARVVLRYLGYTPMERPRLDTAFGR
jgi:curved DNA-binding protein CbpA